MRSARAILLGGMVAAIGIVVVYAMLLHPWLMRWGATTDETDMPLPGDRYIPPDTVVSTRAISIDAPASEVWPWIAQLGQGRGGFYSYIWLENLFAADMYNADRIVPELQQIDIGDHLEFARDGPFDMVVTVVIPERALVTEGGWAWYLQPIDEHSTRLIVRYASFPVATFFDKLYYYPIFEPAHFVMEAGMMLGIKQRAENNVARAAMREVEATKW